MTLRMEVSLTGVTPMIIHNGRTANPMNSYSKAMKNITSKRKKTEEDIEELLSIQWESSLYWSDKIGLHMPTENILAALLKAAKKHKLGPSISGFVFDEAVGFPIIAPHHDNFEEFKKDLSNKFVKAVTIQRSKTISCRCILNNWALSFSCEIDESIIDPSSAKLVVETMSKRIGLGVWTPSHPKPGTFGKFLINRLAFVNTETNEIKEYKLS